MKRSTSVPSPSGGLAWFKSSYSGSQGGQCVEIAECTDTVHVRDSKDTAGPQLRFTPSGWSAFVDFARLDG